MRSLTFHEVITGAFELLVPVREEPRGSNRGQMVDSFARAAGYDPKDGLPWCLMVIYAIGRAFWKSEWILPRTGSCDLLYEWAKREGRLRPAGERPRVGDIGLVQPKGPFNPRNPAEHVFFIEDVRGNRLTTREGNTSDPSEKDPAKLREGVGIFKRSRVHGGPIVYHYIRIGAE